MMPSSRFSFDDSGSDANRDLLAKADFLNISLRRDPEKGVVASFELSGCMSAGDDDDGSFAPASGLAFVRGLIERFEKVKD
jgi:hypothetical protein